MTSLITGLVGTEKPSIRPPFSAPSMPVMRPDGCVEMRLETTGRKELVRWVLSWMPDVKVLAPKSLRDRIAEKLRDGLRAQE